MDEHRVYVVKREGRGKNRYALRWLDVASGKWRSKSAGTDSKAAERQAALLVDQLDRGTFRDIRRVTWSDFVEHHVSTIPGAGNAKEAKRTLEEFGDVCKPRYVRGVTYAMIELFLASIRAKGNASETRNKKLRYVRSALNCAVRRGLLAQSPMDSALFEATEEKPPRVVTDDEEVALLDAAETLYGSRMRAFVYAALNTGGRRSELLSLTWSHVVLDGDRPQVHFTKTKSRRDRIVPINGDLVEVLRRVKAQTLADGGPFVGMADNMGRAWSRIIRAAEIKGVSIHDMRRTYTTRLIRAGVPLPTVQKLAGHKDIKTTLRYYNWVSDDDLRDGVRKLVRNTG